MDQLRRIVHYDAAAIYLTDNVDARGTSPKRSSRLSAGRLRPRRSSCSKGRRDRRLGREDRRVGDRRPTSSRTGVTSRRGRRPARRWRAPIVRPGPHHRRVQPRERRHRRLPRGPPRVPQDVRLAGRGGDRARAPDGAALEAAQLERELEIAREHPGVVPARAGARDAGARLARHQPCSYARWAATTSTSSRSPTTSSVSRSATSRARACRRRYHGRRSARPARRDPQRLRDPRSHREGDTPALRDHRPRQVRDRFYGVLDVKNRVLTSRTRATIRRCSCARTVARWLERRRRSPLGVLTDAAYEERRSRFAPRHARALHRRRDRGANADGRAVRRQRLEDLVRAIADRSAVAIVDAIRDPGRGVHRRPAPDDDLTLVVARLV